MKALLDSLLEQVKIAISTFLDTEIRIVMTFSSFQSTSWKWGNHERSQNSMAYFYIEKIITGKIKWFGQSCRESSGAKPLLGTPMYDLNISPHWSSWYFLLTRIFFCSKPFLARPDWNKSWIFAKGFTAVSATKLENKAWNVSQINPSIIVTYTLTVLLFRNIFECEAIPSFIFYLYDIWQKLCKKPL